MSFEHTKHGPDALGEVRVGRANNEILIQVRGAGTHVSAQPLRDCLSQLLDQGHRTFWLNLAQCTYMDSTFLGVLVWTAMRLKTLGDARFAVLNISRRNLNLLQTLGIDRLFQIETVRQAPLAETQSLGGRGSNPEERLATILEAHRALTLADERNGERFKDVIRFLEAEQKPTTPPATAGN
jgi:anti-sigma B factor antagonist